MRASTKTKNTAKVREYSIRLRRRKDGDARFAVDQPKLYAL